MVVRSFGAALLVAWVFGCGETESREPTGDAVATSDVTDAGDATGGAELPECKPQCEGRACGNDGCGGTCGTCEAGQVCTAAQCVPDGCTPNCDGRVCGDDGCGGSCGTCEGGESCAGGQCVAACTPKCQSKTCGPDGCGGTCGDCNAPNTCNATGQCLPPGCTPDCTGKVCGNDGCGGSCGGCGADEVCSAGQCTVSGGGLVCDEVNLPEDFVCPSGEPCQCVGCVEDGVCSLDDDCVCADCAADEFCADPTICEDDGVCSPFNESCLCADCAGHPECGPCVPSCAGLSCGSDGCGGTCGSCSGGDVCAGGQCVEPGSLVCSNATSDADCTATGECACMGCANDGGCTFDDDCVCPECADDAFCGNPENCIDDGVCAPFDEGCACADCQEHPLCEPPCVPSCGGKQCGDDGCGGSCGACGFGTTCTGNACTDLCPGETQVPNCAGAACVDAALLGNGTCDEALYCLEYSWDQADCDPPGDTCAVALTIDALPFTATGTTVGAADDLSTAAGACAPAPGALGSGAADVVYTFTATEETALVITLTTTGGFAGTVSVLTDCAAPDTTCLGGTDAGTLEVTVAAGSTVYIVVDGAQAGAAGGYTLKVAPPTPPAGLLVINEIDYDQPQSDGAEFLEILNAGNGPADLTRWQLEHINGSTGASVYVLDLGDAGSTLAAGAFLVVAVDAVLAVVPANTLKLSAEPNFLQNGAPDGVRLLLDGAFAEGVAWEGTMPGVGEGGTAPTDPGEGALARCPDGADTGDNAVDFLLVPTPTPGAANACP